MQDHPAPGGAHPSKGAAAERSALRRALDLAAGPGIPLGPNPRVGCVILSAEGRILAEGHHRGAGTPHAEADALSRAADAGVPVAGATAVVTLEPCTHHGRTPPCADALADAGIARVVIGRRDPNPQAAGGAEVLQRRGIAVDLQVPAELAARAAALNRGWEHGLLAGRPLVTAKIAQTLDGRVAAADGSSRWITGPAAREEVHTMRSRCDVVLIGAGTARIDRPSLTARRPDGSLHSHQPLRAVMGTGEIPALAEIPGAGQALVLDTHDPHEALTTLHEAGRRHVLLEGGPQLLAAFLRAGCVDELIVHLAPTLLGRGPAAFTDLGIESIDDAQKLELLDVEALPAPGGATDLQLTLRPRPG